MSRARVVRIAPPDESGRCEGLAYALFRPAGEILGSVVILHGAGSAKESHFDYARQARALGFAAIAFDLRGHGESGGALDGDVERDVLAITRLLPDGPVALRGSSLGGYLALAVAQAVEAAAVVAICAASTEGLRRGVRNGTLGGRIDAPSFDGYLRAHDVTAAVAALSVPLLLLHAEGDEIVPVEHSHALLAASGSPTRRLIAVPGGHHRSLQHDEEIQGVSLRFLARALADDAPAAAER